MAVASALAAPALAGGFAEPAAAVTPSPPATGGERGGGSVGLAASGAQSNFDLAPTDED